MASPVGDIVTTPPTTTTTPTAPDKTAQDKDMFLKLLVAQMKYQDPSNPTDSTQFLSQMAQFTQVEKLGDLTDATTNLLTSSQLQSAMGMVGTHVEYGVGSKAGSGKVTGVTVIDGVPQLLLGTTKVPLSDVTGVTAATAASDAADAATAAAAAAAAKAAADAAAAAAAAKAGS
jgi:flagellar basal-body rod modification protein FlgD